MAFSFHSTPVPGVSRGVVKPATGGSAYERLQLTLRRLPTAVQQLHAAVSQRLAAANDGQC